MNLYKSSQPWWSSRFVHPLTVPGFQTLDRVLGATSVEVAFHVELILQQAMVFCLRWVS